MTLQITLTPDTETRLRELARAEGEDISAYAARLVRDAVAAPSVDELLAPFRRQVVESGMTDEQLDAFYEELRTRAHHDRTTSGISQP